ncbi:type ISP restriction/modification enzyme [Candidatus Lokiarchaeum ossiferum]|uniref:type ISP restriction/modification enzyme n=1 Tax=Candidatus Lokiarchaeum ossiferum TaxID=2951803 RepID=UPI00352D076D
MKENKLVPSELSKNYSGTSAFFTPDWMVTCILQGTEYFLTQFFNKPLGLSDPSLVYLEPSAGELIFPLTLFDHIYEKNSKEKFQEIIRSLIKDRLFCYEINLDIYKSGKQNLKRYIQTKRGLGDLNLSFKHFFLENTVEDNNNTEALNNRDQIPHSSEDCLIIFGNPPYSVSNTTNRPWIKSLVEDYKIHLNRPGRKKIVGLKGIQDDYVKFIRLAQWKLADQNHPGIFAFVVNNYFIDGDIFRGMRSSLLSAFDYLYIINLFGDPKKSKSNFSSNQEKQIKTYDENPFDIQTGICLIFAILQKPDCKGKEKREKCKVFYAEKRGSKTQKKQFLLQKFEKISFTEVDPRIDLEFVPISQKLLKKEVEYNSLPYLPEIFQYNIIGIQSLHDTLITHPDKSRLVDILSNFYNGFFSSKEITDTKNQKWVKFDGVSYHDARDWKITDGLAGSLNKAKKKIIKWQWRGFDQWWVAYDENLMTKGSSSYSLMQYFLPPNSNLAIGVSKVSRKADGTSSVFITDQISESHFIEGGSGIGDYIFPLKIGRNKKKKNDWNLPDSACEYNLSSMILRHLNTLYSVQDINPEDIFFYICAILNCSSYSTKYQFFLKKDFPHIPFPKKKSEFIQFSKIGRKFAQLYTLNIDSSSVSQFSLSKAQNMQIISPYYDPLQKKIFFQKNSKDPAINSSNNRFWIGNIDESMWNFEIGGIRQLELWLKHRKYVSLTNSGNVSKKFGFTRSISDDELNRFLKICVVIKTILELKQKVDYLYSQIF